MIKYLLCMFMIFVSLLSYAVDDKEDIKKDVVEEVKSSVKKKKKKNKKSSKKSSSSSSSSKETTNTTTKKAEPETPEQKALRDSLEADHSDRLTHSGKYSSDNYYYKVRDNVNFKSQYNFQYWDPTFIKGSDTNTTILSYNVFELSILKNLYRLRYETSLWGSPIEEQEELLKVRKKESWNKYLADITIPGTHNFYISYVEEIFMGCVTANEVKTYVPHNYDPDADDVSFFEFLPGEKIKFKTKFQDYMAGFKITELGTINGIGLFYTKYDKPYTLTLDDEQNTNYIFDSSFKGGGLFLKLLYDGEMMRISADGKIGLGSIYLKGIDLYLEDIVDDSMVIYSEVIGNVSAKKTTTNGFFSVYSGLDVRYRSFKLHFSDSDDDDKDDDENDSDSIKLNEDIIYNFQLGFSINL